MTTFDEYLAEQLKDPKVKAEYDKLDAEFKAIEEEMKRRAAEEDNADLKAYEAAEAEFKKNSKTYSFQEVLDGYDKKKS